LYIEYEDSSCFPHFEEEEERFAEWMAEEFMGGLSLGE